ncbi:mismatch repair protein [Saccharomycopsis crataegensis]|uniref:DNA mismatch repair protein MSH3 n=1 Tax=Saccharomycopsis crataegensis TaxID=43959 RepID=A0AAV5QKE5_9ASCO|nr:mismatch repair protein [Saccharomycopsis crataegensis]
MSRQPSIMGFFKKPQSAISSPMKVADSEKNQEHQLKETTKMEHFKFTKSQDTLTNYRNSSEKQLVHEKFKEKLKHHNTNGVKRKILTEAAIENQVLQPKKKLAKAKKLTPLETQIVDLKQKNMDKILAINVGYKYKFFGPDARKVAAILNIMVIPGKESIDGSNPNDKLYDKLAYCSIPDTRLHIHLKKLISQGLKVGVVEQTETAAVKSLSSGKNSLFERKLTNVYTSATYIEDEMEDGVFGTKGGDCVVAIMEDKIPDSHGLLQMSVVSVNPVNGEILHDHFQDDFSRNELETRLYHLQPSEYVVMDNLSSRTLDKIKFFQKLKHKIRINQVISSFDSTLTTYNHINDLTDYFKDIPNDSKAELIDFATALPDHTQSCCWLLIQFLKEFNLDGVFKVKINYNPFQDSVAMLLNSNTLESLEIFQNSTNGSERGSLLELLDHTKTVFGYRLLKHWISKPLINREMIEERLQAISDIKANFSKGDLFMESLSNLLSDLPDLEKYLNRLHYKKSNRKEIYLFLKNMDKIVGILSNPIGITQIKSPLLLKCLTNSCRIVKENSKMVKEFLEVIDIQAAMNYKEKDIQIAKFFNKKFGDYGEIETVRSKIQEIEISLTEELVKIRGLLGKSYLEYKSVAKEEYLIEIGRNSLKKIPKDWIKINDTKSVVRFRSPEVIQLLKQLNFQRAKEVEVCESLFIRFLGKIDGYYSEFHSVIKNLAIFDCLFSLTAASFSAYSYVRPSFVDQQIISVKNGRHPIIESLVNNYIANDINMRDYRSRSLVLTGPNMGGKSSYVRQIALIVIMAQIGAYVPADSAVLSIFDGVFTRMGFNDNILKGESTFMVEMRECFNILQRVTSKSLVILDEVGRGTGTTDGISIAYSILDYLTNNEDNKLPFVLFITHYTELCEIEKQYPKLIKNVHMDYTEFKENEEDNLGNVVFLYKVTDGFAKNSYGLNVAKLCSIPESIVNQAYEISRSTESKVKKNRNIHWGLKFRDLVKDSISCESTATYGFKDKISQLMDEENYL